ncbi:beta-lactamase-like protein [Lactarius psammicola]|nr:beta-lactamase-like protein [Lactarius psammicola]
MSGALSPLSLPAYKGSTVGVSALYVGNVSMPTSLLVQTQIPGHDTLDWPLYSFLIENEKADKKVLFDLGLMKAWKEKRPDLLARAQRVNATFEVLADVPEILTSASVSLASIDSIFWSHHHSEHTGDPSLFPPTTSLVVGPGFKSNPSTYPGFPTNPDAHVSQSAYQGRDLVELDFSSNTADVLKVGGLRAIDWFKDGSFYLLEAPGHAPEHIMALARTSEDKFVLLAGDAADHPGIFRPSPLCPLPDAISPSPFEIPTSLLEHVHPSAGGSSFRTTPFYEPTPFRMPDPVAGRATLAALQAFDASPHVFVVLAHDPALRESRAHFSAANLARWEEARGEDPSAGHYSRKDAAHWRFLADFQKGVEERRAGAAV